MKYKNMTKQIVQYSLDGKLIQIFPSLRETARSIGKPKGSSVISACANGVYKTAYGYTWKYITNEEYDVLINN